MKAISTTLAAALMGLLSASVWAQTQAALPGTGAAPQSAASSLLGTRQGEARRKALLAAIEDWKTFLPDRQDDELTKRFQPDLAKIKKEAQELKAPQPISPLEVRFEDWKQQLLTRLFKDNERRFFSDPQIFSEFMQERLDTLAAIRNQKARAPQKIKKLDSLKAQVNTLPDRATLDKIYDQVGGSRVSRSVNPVRVVSFSGPASQVPGPQVQLIAPNLPHPDKTTPPPAQFEPASYKAETADGLTLSGIIAKVSSTAKRYAGKVADAIVSFSRKLGLDEKLQAAIIWAESRFNPHATSEVGAMGLGQLMPGTAQGLGVRNAYDINQNVKGSSTFLKSLLGKFSSDDEIRYTQGLFAWGKTRVESGQSAEDVWKDVFAKTPLGVKNAIAAYNAGSGAIQYYAHGDYTRLPRKYTAAAKARNEGYWQTVNYVPSVLRHYFDIQLQTPSKTSPATSFAI